MIQKMKNCIVLSPTEERDTTGEVIKTYEEVFETDIAISNNSGNTLNSNSVISVNSSHIGITNNKVIKECYKIRCGSKTYSINYVNADGRYTILYLSLDESADD